MVLRECEKETTSVREETVASACHVLACPSVRPSGEGRGAERSRSAEQSTAPRRAGPTRPGRCGRAATRSGLGELANVGSGSQTDMGRQRRCVQRARGSGRIFTVRSTRQDCVLRVRVCVPEEQRFHCTRRLHAPKSNPAVVHPFAVRRTV